MSLNKILCKQENYNRGSNMKMNDDKCFTWFNYEKSMDELRCDISTQLLKMQVISGMIIKDIMDKTGLSRNTVKGVLEYRNNYDLETAYIIACAMCDHIISSSFRPKLSVLVELWELSSEHERNIFKYYINDHDK